MPKVPIRLTEKQEIDLVPTSPFHFNSTFYKPAHFKTADTRWEPGKRWQTMRWSGETLGLLFQNAGTTNQPNVLVNVYSKKKSSSHFLENLQSELIWRYNLHLDVKTFYETVKDEPALRVAIRRFRGMRPMHPGSLYEYLIIAIVLQNATVRRSISMMQALFERYGELVEFDGQKFWCFWEPKALATADEQELRRLKMGYRAKSLTKVSIPFAQEKLKLYGLKAVDSINQRVSIRRSRKETSHSFTASMPWIPAKAGLDEIELRKRSQEEQEKSLLSLYGIGPASVGYIMFDVFHHWDHFTHISPWEQKIYSKIFFDRDPEHPIPVKRLLSHFKRYHPYEQLSVHYPLGRSLVDPPAIAFSDS